MSFCVKSLKLVNHVFYLFYFFCFGTSIVACRYGIITRLRSAWGRNEHVYLGVARCPLTNNNNKKKISQKFFFCVNFFQYYLCRWRFFRMLCFYVCYFPLFLYIYIWVVFSCMFRSVSCINTIYHKKFMDFWTTL